MTRRRDWRVSCTGPVVSGIREMAVLVRSRRVGWSRSTERPDVPASAERAHQLHGRDKATTGQ